MKKFIFPILIFLLVITTYFGYAWFHSITSKIFVNNPKNNQISSIQERLNRNKPIDIILLGYGGGNHDGAYLTDSMMVVHIDPALKKVFLISIPRDIWIKIPTDGATSSYWKINAAYELGLDDANYPNKQAQFKGIDGGGHMVASVVSQVTGFPIDYFVGMDFSGFKKTIDTLGGVDINVETAFTDSQYPIDGKETDLCGKQPSDIPQLDQLAASSSPEIAYPCRYENLHFDKGMQHMDGERALSYVRSRHSLEDGTDFGRAKRQRNLIVAVKQKIFSAGFIPKIFPFMTSLGDDFRTDMTLSDVQIFLTNANTLNKYAVVPLSIQNYLKDATSDDGQAILESVDGIDNWNSVHTYLAQAVSGETDAIVRVENGTTIPGLAQLAVNRLSDKEIQTLPPTNYDAQTFQKTTITVYDNNISPQQLTAIKNEFGIQTVNMSKEKPQGYNVLVTVGSDYNDKQGKKVINEP